MQRVNELDDESLLVSLRALAGANRASIAGIVVHLSEVDERRLHAARGHSSLFTYCVKELRFSEDEACRRIVAARLARRFPEIPRMLEEGTVSLSVIGLLKPVLTATNARELLSGVARKSVQASKEWLAARFPQQDLSETIRKLPVPRELPRGPAEAASPVVESAGTGEGSPLPDPGPAAPRSDIWAAEQLARAEPLSASRFAVRLTIDGSVRDKLERARDLSRHRLPSGKLEALFELALDALLEKIERTKLGKKKGRGNAKAGPVDAAHPAPVEVEDAHDPGRGRTPPQRMQPPRAVRRDVVERDGERCVFVAPDGTRCDCRAFLEFEHVKAAGLGGGSDVANLRLLCKSHNALAAERTYGAAFMKRKIAERQRTARRGTAGSATEERAAPGASDRSFENIGCYPLGAPLHTPDSGEPGADVVEGN